MELPTGLCQIVADTETLIHSIYDYIHDLNIKEDSWLCERSILAPVKDQVTVLNQCMLDKIPGEHDDGLLEVMGVYSSFHIAQLQIGMSEPLRLGQARSIK
ncbi:ATP-dependent DNA helicase, partial [Trichonephila inaurata madagascariensis]